MKANSKPHFEISTFLDEVFCKAPFPKKESEKSRQFYAVRKEHSGSEVDRRVKKKEEEEWKMAKKMVICVENT